MLVYHVGPEANGFVLINVGQICNLNINSYCLLYIYIYIYFFFFFFFFFLTVIIDFM